MFPEIELFLGEDGGETGGLVWLHEVGPCPWAGVTAVGGGLGAEEREEPVLLGIGEEEGFLHIAEHGACVDLLAVAFFFGFEAGEGVALVFAEERDEGIVGGGADSGEGFVIGLGAVGAGGFHGGAGIGVHLFGDLGGGRELVFVEAETFVHGEETCGALLTAFGFPEFGEAVGAVFVAALGGGIVGVSACAAGRVGADGRAGGDGEGGGSRGGCGRG